MVRRSSEPVAPEPSLRRGGAGASCELAATSECFRKLELRDGAKDDKEKSPGESGRETPQRPPEWRRGSCAPTSTASAIMPGASLAARTWPGALGAEPPINLRCVVFSAQNLPKRDGERCALEDVDRKFPALCKYENEQEEMDRSDVISPWVEVQLIA